MVARRRVEDIRIVAIDRDTVVGMCTGVDYIHPDKSPQLWINEVGVAPSHQRQFHLVPMTDS